MERPYLLDRTLTAEPVSNAHSVKSLFEELRASVNLLNEDLKCVSLSALPSPKACLTVKVMRGRECNDSTVSMICSPRTSQSNFACINMARLAVK